MITDPGTLRWLKLSHIICAAVWLGCSAALNIMGFFIDEQNPGEMLGYSHAMLIVDNVLIYRGVTGILGTGIVYGLWTKWGFFRLFWIKLKWALSIAIVAGGTFVRGAAIEGNVQPLDWYAANMSTFQANRAMAGWSGSAQLLLLLIIFFLSVKWPSGR